MVTTVVSAPSTLPSLAHKDLLCIVLPVPRQSFGVSDVMKASTISTSHIPRVGGNQRSRNGEPSLSNWNSSALEFSSSASYDRTPPVGSSNGGEDPR
ncbi:Hypothetical predicted protein [Olea europaea subsp. europaea]|uniref:Uncharacterized protein n=1 Tax=Olea europaea subsp. europaea TaxID=158383 RepID=A0A8S0VA24_OLEEU|nr:Hypothetical predicted protein [Olea europaea subsp. europaea]